MNINPFPLFLLQDPTPVETEIVEQSFLDIIIQSGPIGIAIIAFILILSVMGLYIFIERYLTIKRASKVDENFMHNIRTNVQAGNIGAAKALCQTTDSPMARMVEKGLQRIGKPTRDINAAIENVGNLEVFKLEKNLSTIASISGAAPMLGFFGTVTGMIMAFYNMAKESTVTPEILAGGIYQALLTTAFGLFVGILSFIGYNYLVGNVDKVIFKMESTATEFMDMLQEPTE